MLRAGTDVGEAQGRKQFRDGPLAIDHLETKMIILDMDSSVSPTHGEQEGTAYNGHFGCTCYHPLFLFNQFGDLEWCSLRSGNVHNADGWCDALNPHFPGELRRWTL